ncbi:MAG: hypothetical protein H6698_03480 [Myxococcales bacterium]|nr:hypothetical protein [Myxococcales bacterium]MCB9519287.1 hypothetical protein [Myxococcales bacterium]MCB9530731.1 hypothetical protein [Myxococcales bacterium]MCB9533375.1 hypothetical protein [Myxococcales bacterium]
MFFDIAIIDERERRERRQWEPIPLHAPTPERRDRPPQRPVDSETEPGGTVIVIDLDDYSETRI